MRCIFLHIGSSQFGSSYKKLRNAVRHTTTVRYVHLICLRAHMFSTSLESVVSTNKWFFDSTCTCKRRKSLFHCSLDHIVYVTASGGLSQSNVLTCLRFLCMPCNESTLLTSPALSSILLFSQICWALL